MRLLILLALLAACEKREETRSPPPPTTTSPAEPPTEPGARAKLNIAPEAPADLPPSCARYRLIVARLAQCESMPAESRAALKQGFEAMEQAWGDIPSLPAEVKSQMSTACQNGVDALNQAAKALCPEILKVERE